MWWIKLNYFIYFFIKYEKYDLFLSMLFHMWYDVIVFLSIWLVRITCINFFLNTRFRIYIDFQQLLSGPLVKFLCLIKSFFEYDSILCMLNGTCLIIHDDVIIFFDSCDECMDWNWSLIIWSFWFRFDVRPWFGLGFL